MSTVIDDETTKANLSANISARLAELGLTQSDLARATGDTPMHISRIIRKENVPSASVLGRLAEALKVSADYLLADHEPPKKTSRRA